MNEHHPLGYYAGPPAGDFAAADDPFQLFAEWMEEARVHEPNDPDAAALATVDGAGAPNVRMVLVKAADDRGFVVYTNSESAKGRELGTAKAAALCLYWKSLRRQVRARGPVEVVDAAEADAYFQSRPRGSRIGAWASQQSRPLSGRAELEQAVVEAKRRFGDGDVPRPPHWLGYRLAPREIEFWHDRSFRLHDRVVFRRDAAGRPWDKSRLYP